ncbi:MAG TPA: UDP-N-acetylglucosamine 2-epimerase (non-hydrolyzing) [Terracidiphilus sp.]|nr:UDP-N-acetylglucosamine 2-epimerase (non-hydrolyzing) [Terracidiphilus sp.]
MKRTLMHVVGNRPQFIKLAAVLRVLQDRDCENVIVHSGQHYDYDMSKLFFEQLEIPEPAFFLNAGSGNHGCQTGRILMELDTVMSRISPDISIVYGDTNTTLAGALHAYKSHLPLAHVEAGLREYLWRPEELNKRTADHCSDLCFCPTEAAVRNLRNEGLSEDRIHLTGDVTYDSFLWAKSNIDRVATLPAPTERFWLLTLHRAETVDDPGRLSTIVDSLSECEIPLYLPLHPRTRLRLHETGLWDRISALPALHVLPPLGYFDFIRLLVHCDALVTDSGGVIREGYYARKPTVILDNSTEYRELVEKGAARIAGHDRASIAAAFDAVPTLCKNGHGSKLFGDGHAAEAIADLLLQCSLTKKEF